MAEDSNNLDLGLWLDHEIMSRQNKLKEQFWEILAEVGNCIGNEALLKIHPESRGVKLSKGNELLGYPYQVLDLVRDFDPTHGLNIRLLNWFGHGLFIFVLIGKNHPKASLEQFVRNDWAFDLSPTPWDYEEILLNDSFTKSPIPSDLEKSNYFQWHKSIVLSKEKQLIKIEMVNELKKLIFLLS